MRFFRRIGSIVNSVAQIPNGNIYEVFFRRLIFGALASLSLYLSTWDTIDRGQDIFKAFYGDRQVNFDFVIVGSGTAGSLLAYRLSENYKVLLLEAGGDPNPLQSIPSFGFSMLNEPQVDWSHRTVPQLKSCFALNNNASNWSQGKSLGGTSNLNYMTHLRGHPKDFDNWAEITNDPEWTYENILPYFKLTENFLDDQKFTDPTLHGKDGPFHIRYPSVVGLGNSWIEAGREFGYKEVDLNGQSGEGFERVRLVTRRGRRDGNFHSLIAPARRRMNLSIFKFAQVNKILFKKETKTAYGVEFKRHGQTKYAFASKEIIISAGTINSAKLLMLSGVGPADDLESLGIPVIEDLPVGRNLQDHVSTLLGPFFVNPGKSFLADRDVSRVSFQQFWENGTGILTSSSIEASSILSSSEAKKDNWPNIALHLRSFSTHSTFGSDLAKATNLKESIVTEYYSTVLGKDAFFISVSNARPMSKGELKLNTSDPYDSMLIDPKYLEDPRDVTVLIEGINIAMKIAEESAAFKEIGSKYLDKKFPGCEEHIFKSREYFDCYVHQMTLTMYDYVGSCSMGNRDSPLAVVDPEFRVIGVKGLRVIDASVMPKIVTGGTSATALMLAERGADIIKRDWTLEENLNRFRINLNGQNTVLAQNGLFSKIKVTPLSPEVKIPKDGKIKPVAENSKIPEIPNPPGLIEDEIDFEGISPVINKALPPAGFKPSNESEMKTNETALEQTLTQAISPSEERSAKLSTMSEFPRQTSSIRSIKDTLDYVHNRTGSMRIYIEPVGKGFPKLFFHPKASDYEEEEEEEESEEDDEDDDEDDS